MTSSHRSTLQALEAEMYMRAPFASTSDPVAQQIRAWADTLHTLTEQEVTPVTPFDNPMVKAAIASRNEEIRGLEAEIAMMRQRELNTEGICLPCGKSWGTVNSLCSFSDLHISKLASSSESAGHTKAPVEAIAVEGGLSAWRNDPATGEPLKRETCVTGVAPSDTSPVLAFHNWCERRIASGQPPFNPDEYMAAQAGFFAAHPGDGPSSAFQGPRMPQWMVDRANLFKSAFTPVPLSESAGGPWTTTKGDAGSHNGPPQMAHPSDRERLIAKLEHWARELEASAERMRWLSSSMPYESELAYNRSSSIREAIAAPRQPPEPDAPQDWDTMKKRLLLTWPWTNELEQKYQARPAFDEAAYAAREDELRRQLTELQEVNALFVRTINDQARRLVSQ